MERPVKSSFRSGAKITLNVAACLMISMGAGMALTPEQIERLREAKSQFEAGLVTQPIYEEMQRKILDLPAPGPAAAQKSAVLDKLTSGYWRLTEKVGSDSPDDGPVYRFRYRDGKLRMVRFKSNYGDEPGRAVEQEVKELSVAADQVAISYIDPVEDEPRPLVIGLDEKGDFKVQGLLGPPFVCTLTPAPVHTDGEWNAWYRDNSTQDLINHLSTVTEIWRTNGEPNHLVDSDGFVVWYNAVHVPRHYQDDFGETLRPLILKVQKTEKGFRITERFDYMKDAWTGFPEDLREASLLEVMSEGLMDGRVTEAKWQDYVQRQRAFDKERGITPRSALPLKEGGIRRGKSPHVSAEEE